MKIYVFVNDRQKWLFKYRVKQEYAKDEIKVENKYPSKLIDITINTYM